MFISFNTKNKITRMTERKEKVSGQIEVLKKQQKVKSETLIKANEAKKVAISNSTEAQIASLKAQIETLKSQKETECERCNQELKVELDKAINYFNGKILAKSNELTRLINSIEAENKNNVAVMQPTPVNAPTTKVLVENKTKKN